MNIRIIQTICVGAFLFTPKLLNINAFLYRLGIKQLNKHQHGPQKRALLLFSLHIPLLHYLVL